MFRLNSTKIFNESYFLHLYEKLHADQDQYFFCFVLDVDHLCELFSFSD